MLQKHTWVRTNTAGVTHKLISTLEFVIPTPEGLSF